MPLKAKVQFPKDMASPSTAEEHLCFLPAYEKWRTGDITRQQYLHHALLHWTGMKHEFDHKDWYETDQLFDKDPFGFALWKWQHDATNVRDVGDLEAVFGALERGEPSAVEAKLSVLPEVARNRLERVLAPIALERRNLGVLQLCLQGDHGTMDPGPPISPFKTMANQVQRTAEPELYNLIEKSDWRKKCRRGKPLPPWGAELPGGLSPRGD